MRDFHDYVAYGNDILGCVLMFPDMVDNFERLTPDHFHNPYQTILWMLILRYVKEGKAIKPHLLVPELCSLCVSDKEDTDHIAKVKEWFVGIMMFMTPIRDIKDYGRLLVEHEVRARLLAVMDESRRTLEAHGSVITTVTEDLIASVTKVSCDVGFNKKYDDIPTMVDKLLREMDELRRSGGGISTGIPELDELMAGGFHRPDFVIIGGASNMGKTSFAMNCAVHAARNGVPIGFFSLEMTETQLMARILADLAGIASDAFRRNAITESDYYLIDEKRREMGAMTILVDDTSGIRIDVLRARARQMKREKNIRMLFVDYLQLISSPEGSKYGTRAEEVAEISKQLKGLAKELSIPVIALAQLNTKSIQKRENPRPQMEDISESSGIYNDADAVLLLFREEYYHVKKKPPEHEAQKFFEWEDRLLSLKGKAEIIIGKSRLGAIDDVKVGFNHRMTKFYPLSN